MQSAKSIMLLVFISLFACVAPAFADEDSGIVHETIYPVYDEVDLIPTVRIDYAKPRIVVRSTYPRLTSIGANEHVELFNQLVSDLIKEETAEFKNRVAEKQGLQKNLAKSDIKNELTIDFDTSVVNTHDKPIMSVRFNIHGYVAGTTRPYHYHRVLNFDLDNGQKIELADLFKIDEDYLTFLSDYSRKVLSKKLRNKEMIRNGTQPIPENFKRWNVNPTGLLITFDEYQVAPYVYGTQTVLIPYVALKQFIMPDSPIGLCLKQRKKCLRNHLLTGGFMNEA
ncbi:RsiV family protein [Aquicella lusitana]|uniref:Uncharacterized protein DUF3298 n=1 Tax=Aquicella lusitana TaxID=254246 RepID=A0A370G3E1_9COXI|nr:RsiV family protein [Aquicella lusitana]RDI38381.1 uncharacterized protein DUF3298 [Aquicella lusitana]VVC72394.1 Peptidoglycan-N-acetylmuramic acid deacetylase PdaC [Aquicella lusitana]